MTRIKPRRGSYVEALEHFGSGDFRSCVDSLTESLLPESVILRSRALVRLGDAALAIENLGSHEIFQDSHELAAEALAVQSYALYVLNRPLEASNVGIEARARCFSSGLVGIEAELLFAAAIGHAVGGDFDAAEISAIAILDLEDNSPSWVIPKSYAYSLQFWRARACDLRGIVENMRKNYAGYASWSRQAFEEFDKSGVRDDYTHVTLLANYADAAILYGTDNIVDFVLGRAEQIAWNPSLIAHEFRVFSALAEASSAAGDQIGALRYFRRCLDCAPSAALKIRAGVERGRLLHEIGEKLSAREELEHAVRLSRTINWESANSLDQRQLVMLAGQVAKYDGKQASTLLARYDSLSTSYDTGVVIKDERYRGEELAARAAVMQAAGSDDRATIMLIDALESFSGAHLDAKAALVAIELAELTGEPRYLEISRKQSLKQPMSILARKLAYIDRSEFVESPRPDRAPSVAVIRDRPKLVLLS